MGGEEVTIETGRLAQQAGGSVTVRVGDTMIFCTATMSKSIREGLDFFPLSVDYEEKLYAAGRIPGSFMRREGRPSDRAILISRVIDRTLRPLFPKNMLNEVQIILTSLSTDQEHQIDMLGIIAASTALMISDVPWDGPVAGVRIGLIDDELVVNPLVSQMENSKLDLRVSGTSNAINMVECNADEVDEETMIRALTLAQEAIQPIIALQEKIREAVGKEKSDYVTQPHDDELEAEIRAAYSDRIAALIREHSERHARKEAMDALEEEVLASYVIRNESLPEEGQVSLKFVAKAVDTVFAEQVRSRTVNEGIRADGRDLTTIRPLSAAVDIVPRVHGTGLFQRGETQVLTVATLGTPRDSQLIDDLTLEDSKRYLHHYNFPPYSTGETRPLRGPKRREIGHGALAENALLPMIPDEKEFPYTIRLVSEVMSSNGSTSMASVCGSTLALMDAGVPIKRPVGGIAMGLIKEEDKVAVLTDIQGLEDHIGDMDFKVAGTEVGITALQMDIKISGVTEDVMRQALSQARDARMQILGVMRQAIEAPREDLKESAPRMISLKIDPEKIGAVIGPGGKTVRSIQDTLNVKIDIQEDGTVFVAGDDGPTVYKARDRIQGLVEEAKVGAVYTGKITRLEDYGVFVEFLPGKEGLVHVSQLADYRVESVRDEFNMDDEIMVMVTDVDPTGRVRLSRQAVLEGWTVEEARERDSGGRGGRRSSGGGGGGDRRGGGGGNRGGDRRGGGGGGGNRGRRD
ncbi:polyribonucleotide nucleotidyltransferase [Phototrophicus methaneseepsis]|uniref:Polyribonucleotide nucleotidyltransferase n=2 Tax=Phototrophicus methaneseepsis TaxID=2710758 RepID=A0A7S8IG00_9CHLR|nr:polyribonucleotide nucleotidyltransferase [Phototrophicus methaneseepsis]